MIGTIALIFAGVSTALGATFNVTVGADGQLAFNPEFIRASTGDLFNFIL